MALPTGMNTYLKTHRALFQAENLAMTPSKQRVTALDSEVKWSNRSLNLRTLEILTLEIDWCGNEIMT